jgi:arylsulfatase A-like enzyme
MNSSGPNVLLIILDSVRAKNVGLYGYHRETTPFLSSYAEQATIYQQARAPGIHSVASHASIWTGAQVDEHMMTQHEDQLRPGTTVWEELDGQGYETGLFTTNTVVAHASNLAECFDTQVTGERVTTDRKPFPEAHGPTDVVKHEGAVGNLRRALEDDHPHKAFLNNLHHLYEKRQKRQRQQPSSCELVNRLLDWQSSVDHPWAACLNLMDAHFPYEPAAAFDRWGGKRLQRLHDELDRPPANAFIGGRPWWQLRAFESLYDGTIRQLDAILSDLIKGLKQANAHDDTFVVITSDHGEGFGEVSQLTNRTRLVAHSWGIGEELTHVPLLVKDPGQTVRKSIKEPATLTMFPESVKTVVRSDGQDSSFVPDGPVLASTHRLRAENHLLFEGSEEDADDYYGPWRAVYRIEDDEVYKHAKRGDNSITIRIWNAQHNAPTGQDGQAIVDTAFDSINESGLKKTEQNTLSTEVEDQLTELGYLR